MHHRRSPSDSKSTTNSNNSFSSLPIKNRTQSTSSLLSSTTNSVSIDSMREKITLNKITRISNDTVPDNETEVINRETPIIYLDNHLTYCFYINLQNLIHVNAIHILLYHAVFWLNPNQTQENQSQFSKNIEKTEYEQTLFITLSNEHDGIIRSPINIHLINKYIYITLISVSLIELLTAYLWTLQKKVFLHVYKNLKYRNLLCLILFGIIIILYLIFIAWLYFHTFITHYLTLSIFCIVIIHFIILIVLDKPNLFRRSSVNLFKDLYSISNINRKQYRPYNSSVLTSTILNRSSYRSSSTMQSRKVNSLFSSFIFSSRWLSITEEKFNEHKCSLHYSQIRQEANDLWLMVIRRIVLSCYRTFASFILFDFIPFKIMAADVRSVDYERYIMLILICALTTFITHIIFLFPVKFQTNLYHLASHLGRWRLQSFLRTDTINEWSSECNSYVRGHTIRLSSNNDKYFIAEHPLSNAAHPQSISHSILYRLFGNTRYFLTIQFLIFIILIVCQFLWILHGKFWYEILISILIILNSSYTIFKIIRNRLIFNMINDNECDEIILPTKSKKSN
ncbi:unnamed protein product [Adineta steineri]|uniref:Uncharacterized protein n=1 Tax=Adineta steineri TaxID=433720 RepID=A0A818FP60_9BILA|nr:unnamed protein product [Adineta steineri]CAF3479156.1 unnamed protein product [Adineta steineri]